MPRLVWGTPGQRFYETGVDQGVLYVGTNAGVAWSGLTSVSESRSGGGARPYYLDGIKYLNLASAEEFEATIEAFFAPAEFGPCDGTVSVRNGLFVTQQARKSFGFSYRTKLGNDLNGVDYAYKIHLVYNALAEPAERTHKTLGDSTDPDSLSWTITTKPPIGTGYKPTAHFVIDSRFTAPFRLKAIEDILYGSTVASPRLPTADELVWLFSELAFPPLKAVLIGPNTYEIHEVDPADARSVTQPTRPLVSVGEPPVLWFDNSAGTYSIPKLVTGG